LLKKKVAKNKKTNHYSAPKIGSPVILMNPSYNEVQATTSSEFLLFSAVCAKWQKIFVQARKVNEDKESQTTRKSLEYQ
jgi:hypothetical protein